MTKGVQGLRMTNDVQDLRITKYGKDKEKK
jgi:hypothetical protein